MGNNGISLKVLNPRGKIAQAPRKPLSNRLGDLAGKNIALLSNTQIGAELMLPYLEKALQSRIPSVKLRAWRVRFNTSPAEKDPKLREIAAQSDGVVAMMGE